MNNLKDELPIGIYSNTSLQSSDNDANVTDGDFDAKILPRLKGHGGFTFESGEHEDIGNSVSLKYSNDKRVKGKDFDYKVGSNTLSFGLVVALAGDFYGNFTFGPGDVEQISDKWDTDPESSIRLALDLANQISTDKAGYLSRVINLMNEQRKEVRDAIDAGQDVAQAYKKISGSYDTSYTIATRGAYPLIALSNWDHFGEDAIKAYSAVHTAALRQAKGAHEGDKSEAEQKLKEAYFLEAFAQHYLTDLFSTGHLRTPRRELHSTYFGQPEDPKIPRVYPLDQCAHAMHDEDCANGLWVTNKDGESWAAYGDKQLWSGKAYNDLQVAKAAAQVGVDEIWDTQDSGVIPGTFKALNKIPILDRLYTDTNFVPLFQPAKAGNDVYLLDYRSDLDERNDPAVTQIKTTEYTWSALYNRIDKSGPQINMYPFTKSFQNLDITWHLKLTSNELIVNGYASGSGSVPWTMSRRFTVNKPASFPQNIAGISAEPVGNQSYSIVGRIKENTDKYSTYHLGIKISDREGANILWDQTFQDDNLTYKPGEVVYGLFRDSGLSMAKYWSTNNEAKVEVWCVDSSYGTKKETEYSLKYPIKLQKSDTLDYICHYGYESGKTHWLFTNFWNPSQPIEYSYEESLAFPAQALFQKKINDIHFIIRIFYGPTYPPANKIRIDVIYFTLDQGKVTPVVKTQEFGITWGSLATTGYLTWFIGGIKKSGGADLVTLVTNAPLKSGGEQNEADLFVKTVVFPNTGGTAPQFSAPVVTDIKLDPSNFPLFNASFMKPVFTQITSANIEAEGAILMFFDNYGLLGVRCLSPVRDSYTYEVCGQVPAIAGQLSQSLGFTAEDWMGRGERPRSIGFLVGHE